jgi:hypothetical protein
MDRSVNLPRAKRIAQEAGRPPCIEAVSVKGDRQPFRRFSRRQLAPELHDLGISAESPRGFYGGMLRQQGEI